MPSIQSPLGALPARFRRPRVLIVGCGDVGLRAARLLLPRVRVLALARSGASANGLRAAGIQPLAGDLDDADSLRRLAGLATHVLHLAPPAGGKAGDARTQALRAALARRTAPVALVYGSTTGVYGDAAGEWVSETQPIHPRTARAQARAAAEEGVRALGRGRGTRASILRIPAIYAPDRPTGTARERLLQGTPALRADDDVWASRIHADDLARACVLALWRGRPQRVVNVSDDRPMKMGEYLDLAAELYGLPPPPRMSRVEAAQTLSPLRLSFMSESRRVGNARLKRELRLRLRHPGPDTGLLSSALRA